MPLPSRARSLPHAAHCAKDIPLPPLEAGPSGTARTREVTDWRIPSPGPLSNHAAMLLPIPYRQGCSCAAFYASSWSSLRKSSDKVLLLPGIRTHWNSYYVVDHIRLFLLRNRSHKLDEDQQSELFRLEHRLLHCLSVGAIGIRPMDERSSASSSAAGVLRMRL